MMSALLNNRVRVGRRHKHKANGHRLLRDDDDEEADGDDGKFDDDNNCHRRSRNTNDRNKHRQSMAITSDATQIRRGGRATKQPVRVVHSTSSLSATTATSCTETETTTTTTSFFPKLKSKSMKTQAVSGKNNSGVKIISAQEQQQQQLPSNRRKNHRRRYLCSFDNDDNDYNDNEDDHNATDNSNGNVSFPSIGYDDETEASNISFPPQSHRLYGQRPTTRIIHGSTGNKYGGLKGNNQHHNIGLTRLVLLTKQGNLALSTAAVGGKRKVLQRDLTLRGRVIVSTDKITSSSLTKKEEEEEEEKLQPKDDETEVKQINDNVCVYQYAEDDQSVELDAAEIIYASVSLSTLAAEEGEENDNTVRERKFSLFHQVEGGDDSHEDCGYDGMGGGGCSILDLIGVPGRTTDVENSREGGETSAQRRMRQRQEQLQNLGKYGWHRAQSEMVALLDIPSISPTVASATGIVTPTINTNSYGADASSSFPCLDRFSVAHILQNVQPTMDEYSAIHDEHNHLLKEIECLEKDRVQLELLFYGAVEDAEEERKYVASTRDGGGGGGEVINLDRIRSRSQLTKAKDAIDYPTRLMTYQTFRTALNRMTRSCQKVDEEILKSPLPVMWLVEDILPLMATEFSDGDITKLNNDTVSTKSKKKKRQFFQSISSSYTEDNEPSLEDRLRDFRGDGIALLIADHQSRSSLVDTLCSQSLPKMKKKNPSYGIGSTSFSSTGTSSYYAPPATCSSSVTNVSIDPTSLDMFAIMKLKSEGDDTHENGTFDYQCDEYADGDDDDDDPSAAILIDEGGTYLTHCALTGGLPSTVPSKDGNGPQDDKTTSLSTYFLKFDNGEIFHGGCIRNSLPSNLVLRLVREERDPSTIKYLSTGPLFFWESGGGAGAGYNTNNRCYYAEFEDGECWWGTNNDSVLDRIFMDMDVHRVAFGSCSSTSEGTVDGAGFASSPSDITVGKSLSFVVIGKDGSVKWKNIPRELQRALVAQDSNDAAKTRMGNNFKASLDEHEHAAAAPCEVSLGVDGSYFVRFLDGTVDYVLPAFAADIFDTLEACGKQVRNVALHVDTYDCLIRYSS